MLGAYMYVFLYLAFPLFRRPILLEYTLYSIYNRTNFVKNLYLNKIN
jgi:hypothetical protein